MLAGSTGLPLDWAARGLTVGLHMLIPCIAYLAARGLGLGRRGAVLAALVYAANADGEHATPVAIPLIDNFVRAAPLTVGATPIDWLDTSLAYDRKNRRVVLAGATRGSPSARVLLCEPGFTACQAKDASAGRSTTEFSRHLQVLVDEAGDKLLVFQTYPTGLDKTKPALSRCNLDGTACEAIDLSVGQTGTAGENFNAAIDPVGKRFYVATTNLAAGQLGLVRCALDGTGCVYKDAGAAASAPAPNVHPNVAVDRASMRIGIVSRDAAVETTERRLHLTTCDLDGDACATVRAHALQPPQSGLFPRAVFDARTGTMLTVARNDANGGRASLYRCGVGSRLCSHADVSAGAAEQSTTNRAAVALFPDRDALFFVTFGNAGGGSGYQLSLYRCRSDGSDCTARLLSQTGRYGGEPTMVIDPDSKAMYVAAEESATRQVVGFSLRAW